MENFSPTIKETTGESMATVEAYRNKGYLALTAEDLISIGEIPDKQLADNPGKTWAEIMSDEEIIEYFQNQRQLIELQKTNGSIDMVNQWQENLAKSMAYLEKIGRLPEGIVSDATVLDSKDLFQK